MLDSSRVPANRSRRSVRLIASDTMDPQEASLFHRIGGDSAIMATVTLFYEKVRADEQLSGFFRGMDMEAQIQKQVAFMTMAFGGPHEYSGRDLTTAHAGLVHRGLRDEHFDRVASCLQASLEELSVNPVLVHEALGLVEATRDAVFGREA